MLPISIGKKPVTGDLVDSLLDCHQRIRTFTHLAVNLGARDDLPDAELIDACERCEHYFVEALPRHVDDEEQSVLPRLRGLKPEVDAALETMEQQHREHEPLLEALLAALRALRASPRDALLGGRVAVAAKTLAKQFEEHLQLEEAVIFPCVRGVLPADKQAEITAEMRARRSTKSTA